MRVEPLIVFGNRAGVCGVPPGLRHEVRDDLAIPSFEKLAEIAFIEQQHTVDMFDTSQISNPYADEARRHFLSALQQLQTEIEAHRAGKPASEV